jgi:5'(3')-deoxyribonucleotidase
MLTIAWDIDDVLNNLMQEWFEKQWLIDHPKCTIEYEDLKENPPHKILGVELKKYHDSLDEFVFSGKYMDMEPVSGILEWFQKDGYKCRHIALTANPAASVCAAWLFKHYGEWIRTFHFVPFGRKDMIKYDDSKRNWLEWLDGKVDIFIDDNEDNLIGVKELGITTILHPKPWNIHKNIHNTLKLFNVIL